MSFPLRDLPVMQNWDCQSCGDCCRRMEGVITDEEKRRIEALDLLCTGYRPERNRLVLLLSAFRTRFWNSNGARVVAIEKKFVYSISSL